MLENAHIRHTGRGEAHTFLSRASNYQRTHARKHTALLFCSMAAHSGGGKWRESAAAAAAAWRARHTQREKPLDEYARRLYTHVNVLYIQRCRHTQHVLGFRAVFIFPAPAPVIILCKRSSNVPRDIRYQHDESMESSQSSSFVFARGRARVSVAAKVICKTSAAARPLTHSLSPFLSIFLLLVRPCASGRSRTSLRLRFSL